MGLSFLFQKLNFVIQNRDVHTVKYTILAHNTEFQKVKETLA